MRPTPRRLIPPLAVIAALALVAALAPNTRAADASVEIADMAFAPGDVTVNVGDTVTWTNADPGMVHTVTSTSGAFDSGDMDEGESYSVTFTAPGTYAYLCTPHPFMTGTVTVVAAAVAPAPSASGEIPNVAMPVPPVVPHAALGLVLIGSAVAIAVVARRRASVLAADERSQRVD